VKSAHRERNGLRRQTSPSPPQPAHPDLASRFQAVANTAPGRFACGFSPSGSAITSISAMADSLLDKALPRFKVEREG
jgi:hypothetical protein